MLCHYLGEAGLKKCASSNPLPVSAANDVQAAGRAIKGDVMDLPIADSMLIDMKTLELLSVFRQDRRSNRLPIIILGFQSGRDDKLQAVESAGVHFITIQPVGACSSDSSGSTKDKQNGISATCSKSSIYII